MSEEKPEFGPLHIPWFLDPNAEQIDVPGLFWNLEKTIEKNPEKWGWAEPCIAILVEKGSACMAPSVSYSLATGYRCEEHRF